MMISIKTTRLPAIVAALMLALWGGHAAATSILPVSLQRMAESAEMIFHGKAISNEVRLDPVSGRVATFTTFEVIDVIKGTPGARHTIKQIGGELPGTRVRQIIHGVPRFAAGRDYVVFLPEASRLGFASPVGLSQGKFDIRELDGETVVTNGRPLEALVKTPPGQDLPKTLSIGESGAAPGLQALPGHPASIRLSDFTQAVRTMVGE